MDDETLVFDIEHRGIGILCVETGNIDIYSRNELLTGAIRLLNAKHIISWNGTNKEKFDQKSLRTILKLKHEDPIPFKGTHDDMMSVCWNIKGEDLDGYRNSGYFSMSLMETYQIRFKDLFPLPPRGNSHLLNDVYATYRLWKCWKDGTLLIDFIEEKHSAIEQAKQHIQDRGILQE